MVLAAKLHIISVERVKFGGEFDFSGCRCFFFQFPGSRHGSLPSDLHAELCYTTALPDRAMPFTVGEDNRQQEPYVFSIHGCHRKRCDGEHQGWCGKPNLGTISA